MAQSAGRQRERIVCENCELPYYADEDGCPYCDETVEAETAPEVTDEDDEFVFGSDEPGGDTEAAGADDGGHGLVGRLKRALGL